MKNNNIMLDIADDQNICEHRITNIVTENIIQNDIMLQQIMDELSVTEQIDSLR